MIPLVAVCGPNGGRNRPRSRIIPRILVCSMLLIGALLPTMVVSLEKCEVNGSSIVVNPTQQCILNTDSISTLDIVSVEGTLILVGGIRTLKVNESFISGSMQTQGT